MSLSTAAQRVHRVLKESGPRKLTVIEGLIDGTKSDLHRVVGELFIVGVVKWVGKKRGRQLAAANALERRRAA